MVNTTVSSPEHVVERENNLGEAELSFFKYQFGTLNVLSMKH